MDQSIVDLTQRHKAAAARLYLDVFGAGDLSAADSILAADATSHGPGTPADFGRESIKRQAVALRAAMPDLTVVLEDQVAEADRVASRWSATGTFTGVLRMPAGEVQPSGGRISFTEIRIDRFAHGLIVESWFIPDRLTFWQQIGLV
jgi:predicted ester cyclase